MVFMCWASVISAGCGLCIAASGPSPLPRSPWHWAHSSKYSPRAAFRLESDGGSGFLSFLNSSGTTHGLFCCQAEYASTMQIRTSTEAKRILRVFRLGCATVDMAARKILAQRTTQRKQPGGGGSALCSYLERNAIARNLPRPSQHLIYDHGDHKQHVDSERPKEDLLKPPQATPGNRLLPDRGQLIQLKRRQNEFLIGGNRRTVSLVFCAHT